MNFSPCCRKHVFDYYWDGAEPHSGMTRENIPGDDRMVATGASGFGIMTLVVGADRGFVTREQAVERLTKIVTFLEGAQRYHGAWSITVYGATGKTMPVFGTFDNGGDLVETSFLMQGLLAARQYFHGDNPEEQDLYRGTRTFGRRWSANGTANPRPAISFTGIGPRSGRGKFIIR